MFRLCLPTFLIDCKCIDKRAKQFNSLNPQDYARQGYNHEIDWSKGYPNPGGPINYPDDAPEFKNLEGGFIMSKKLSQEERFEENRFKNIDDFKFAIECHSEVEFEWKNKIYGIAHPDGTISVYEYYKPETELVCETADEVLEYMIEDQKLREIITQVKVWDRTI